MKNSTRKLACHHRVAALICLVVLLQSGTLLVPARSSSALAQDEHAFIRQVRKLEMESPAISYPTGLAFSPKADQFHVLAGRQSNQLAPQATDLFLLTPMEKMAGTARITAQVKDPINVTFDPKGNRLLILKTPANQLIEVQAGPDGVLDPRSLTHHRIRHFGLQTPQGMTVDPASGRLFILDAAIPRLVVVDPDADGSFDNAAVSHIDLQLPNTESLRGLAYDPASGHLQVLGLTEQDLYEISATGQVVTTRNLSEFDLRDPQAMVFAPSGDRTDDPAQMSLYLTDSGLDVTQSQSPRASQVEQTDSEPITQMGAKAFLPLVIGGSETGNEGNSVVSASAADAPGQIVELSFVQSAAPEASTSQTSLVQTIDASLWSPPSPDSAGITYLPTSDTLLVADSEVNEIPALFTGDNLFEANRSGSLLGTMTTIPFADEPTGITVNPANGHLFISDDTGIGSIYEVDPGPDGAYDTPDDIVTSFSTETYDSHDPEGVTFDPTQGVLFIADGLNNEVYRVAPGPNGVFDGVPPIGDDVMTHFDTAILGLLDPEGIVFESDSGHLYLVGRPVTSVVHATKSGDLLRLLDIAEAIPKSPAGLTYAPGSLNIGVNNLYIADRGVDNDNDPTENDGRVYEMSIPLLTPGNTAPVVDAGADSTVVLPDSAKLDGTLVSDDGLPSAATMTWSQVSGPGSVTFAQGNAEDTIASFSLPGAYVLRLTAADGELSGMDEVTVIVTGDAAVSFLDVGIVGTEADNPARSSDDAEEIDNAASSLDRFSPDLDMIYDRGVGRTNKLVGLRFQDVNIPSGAFITNAFVQFQVDEASTAVTSLTIEGEAGDNPVTFGFGDKIAPRPRTTASASWTLPLWLTVGEAGSDQRTPNIAAIIQEIVDRAGWSSGNAIVFAISGNGERTAVAFEGDPAGAAKLHVEYQLTVPDVVGQPQADAEAAIVAAGLAVGTATFENSGTVPAGHVISQNPTTGSMVPEGSAVDLLISLGPVTVPDVVGLLKDDAEAAIVAAGLTVGTVTSENSDTVPASHVISQAPVGGTQAAPGAAIDLTVSTGPANVIELGEAGAFAVLGLTGAKIQMDNENPGVIGQVGLGPNGEQDLKAGFIAGRLLIDPDAEDEIPGTAVQGGIVAADLSLVVADVRRASSDASALPATQTFGDIKETRTIEANGWLTVVRVNKIELKDGKSLTLRGGSGDQFVVNVVDNLKLENGSMIRLEGGLQPGNVLFNFLKDDANGEIKSGSSASGIFLAAGDKAKLKIEDAGSTVVGALFAGKEISVAKNARINHFSQAIDEGVDIGEAAAFAVLGLTGAKVQMDNENPGVTGDVGLGPNGEQDLKTGFITGQLSIDPSAENEIPGTAVQNGIVEIDLMPAVAAARRASSNASRLAVTQTFDDIKETRTIEANGLLTVVAVNKIELKDGESLTLRGGSGDRFVVNIADDLKLENGSMILLEGGLQPDSVLFNFLKDDANGEIKSGSSASGIFLAVGDKAKLKVEDAGTIVVGALLAGDEILIEKDARVNRT